MKSKKVLLMGNPNVGKSTVFNELTGMHQHTGNWTGKTVDSTAGKFYYKYNNYELIDLPGTYSLIPSSEEERIAGEYLLKEKYDCVVVVMDSTMLQRNLMLFYQIFEITSKVVVMLNLCDEANKRNIEINKEILQNLLGVPVIKATARSGKGINELLEQIHLISTNSEDYYSKKDYNLNNLDIENITYKAEFVAGKVIKKAPSKREKRRKNRYYEIYIPINESFSNDFDINDIIIRQAKIEDYKDICKICCDDLGYNCSEELVKERLKGLDKNSERVLVAVYNSEVVGYLHAQIYKTLYFEELINFLGLAVSKEYRNKKVGTKLVNEIENWAKENGIKKVRVNSGFSRKEAHEFYRSLGYNNEKEQIRFLKSL